MTKYHVRRISINWCQVPQAECPSICLANYIIQIKFCGTKVDAGLSETWPTRWPHEMETFSAILALCEGNSLVTGEFPSQRSVTRSFDIFFYLRLNKRLSKHCNRYHRPSGWSGVLNWPNFWNPKMHLFHIPKCSFQSRNVHISVLNGPLGYGTIALWNLWKWSIGGQRPRLPPLYIVIRMALLAALKNQQNGRQGPLLQTCLTVIPTWICNHMRSKMWDENTYPSPNFNGITVVVWERVSNFIPHFIIDAIINLCWVLS